MNVVIAIVVAAYVAALLTARWIRRTAERETERLQAIQAVYAAAPVGAIAFQSDEDRVVVSGPPDLDDHVGHALKVHYDATSTLSTATVECSCTKIWELPVAKIHRGT